MQRQALDGAVHVWYACPKWAVRLLRRLGCTAPVARMIAPEHEELVQAFVENMTPETLQALQPVDSIYEECCFLAQDRQGTPHVLQSLSALLQRMLQVRCWARNVAIICCNLCTSACFRKQLDSLLSCKATIHSPRVCTIQHSLRQRCQVCRVAYDISSTTPLQRC